MIRILVSACLLGQPVRYDGGDNTCDDPALDRWREERRLLPLCPEIAGGLPVPRPPAEIVGGAGPEVLRGSARVMASDGQDATECFVRGAHRALAAAQGGGARLAILNDGSPSCGSTYIHDGSFSGTRRAGRGVTASLLAGHGIRVFSERQIGAAEEYLRELEVI